jgi:fucose permease
MESSNTGGASVPFVQQMLHNKLLLLTVVLAASSAAYLVIGIYMLIRH